MQLGLTGLCKPVQGNFLEMPFADDTFDGAYAIEATCHANKARIVHLCPTTLHKFAPESMTCFS